MKNYWNYFCFKVKSATIVKNTMASAPVTSDNQEMISLTSSKIFISSLYAKQPKGTVLRLGDGTEITVV